MVETGKSRETESPGRWLPAPGSLFALTLLFVITSVCCTIGWRLHRQHARMEYFDRLDAYTTTEPAKPIWLHDFVVDRFGKEQRRISSRLPESIFHIRT